jgi:HK97 family phage major capsid protein
LLELIQQKRDAAKALLDKGAEITPEDLKAAEAYRDEIATLEAERKTAEQLEVFKAENEAALKAAAKPVGPVPFSTAAPEVKNEGLQRQGVVTPLYRGKSNIFKGADANEKAYKFGMWFLATIGNAKAKAYCADNGIETKVYNEGVNSQGGYLVPHQFENDLIDLREMYGVFRRNAKVVNMTSDTRSDPRRIGGLTAYWVGESDATLSAMSMTESSLSSLVIRARTIIFLAVRFTRSHDPVDTVPASSAVSATYIWSRSLSIVSSSSSAASIRSLRTICQSYL